jgi:hypothetical protein
MVGLDQVEASKHSFTNDAAVTSEPKWKLDVWAHAENMWKYTSLLMLDILEGVIFVSFAFALDGRALLTREWAQKCIVVSVGFWMGDMFAPAMANAMRLGAPILFYAQSK